VAWSFLDDPDPMVRSKAAGKHALSVRRAVRVAVWRVPRGVRRGW
jgi:hypothetical protein